MNVSEEFGSPKGVLEWLVSGNASARLLDFFVTNKEFDYSETDAAESSGVSLRTVSRELPKFESAGIIKFTRNVGRAKMYKFDQNSEIAKYLEQFVFAAATRRIEASMKESDLQQISTIGENLETARLENR
ncbi:hypothetical protein [Nitrososphaera sp.]|uniref:hypothetical protein n=1 Tax=Nitrososphaera sp. TaxID=1971748 RepID=UPI00307E1448